MASDRPLSEVKLPSGSKRPDEQELVVGEEYPALLSSPTENRGPGEV
jgi:hypothetical protein